jgi:hypothetical protein
MILIELTSDIDSNSSMGFPKAADLPVLAAGWDPTLPLVPPAKWPRGHSPKSKELSTASPPAKRPSGCPMKAESPFSASPPAKHPSGRPLKANSPFPASPLAKHPRG